MHNNNIYLLYKKIYNDNKYLYIHESIFLIIHGNVFFLTRGDV